MQRDNRLKKYKPIELNRLVYAWVQPFGHHNLELTIQVQSKESAKNHNVTLSPSEAHKLRDYLLEKYPIADDEED